MTDKEWLLKLMDTLSVKEDFFEEMGIRWVQLSEETIMWIVDRLRVIAEKMADQMNARCVCPLCGQGHDPKLTGDSGEGKDKHYHEDGPGGGGYPLQ